MYRTALDHFGVFESLHTVGPTQLLGDDSVWHSGQFDGWNVTAAFDGETEYHVWRAFTEHPNSTMYTTYDFGEDCLPV